MPAAPSIVDKFTPQERAEFMREWQSPTSYLTVGIGVMAESTGTVTRYELAKKAGAPKSGESAS